MNDQCNHTKTIIKPIKGTECCSKCEISIKQLEFKNVEGTNVNKFISQGLTKTFTNKSLAEKYATSIRSYIYELLYSFTESVWNEKKNKTETVIITKSYGYAVPK